MNYVERAEVFECSREQLVGITVVPEKIACTAGVLIIVGGPQYRIGSHRQFVHLCRTLADRGIPSMRFDYRGMGDATGPQGSFEEVHDDICAAVERFRRSVPAMKQVLLWGLCDGASAACFYAPHDHTVAGLVLVNPWVRTDESEAKTYLKHYYFKRLFDKSFWKKLWNKQVAISDSVANVYRALRLSRSSQGAEAVASDQSLPIRMARGLERADLPSLFILSGNDYVANEFDDVCKENTTWKKLVRDNTVKRLPGADHTFSSADWRGSVANITAAWILKHFGGQTSNKS